MLKSVLTFWNMKIRNNLKRKKGWQGIILPCFLFFLVSCKEATPEKAMIPFPVIDVRSIIDRPATVPLKDDILDVSYVQLEETDDDDSLIDGVADYAVTDQYIYVLPVKEPRVVLYDRKGHFIKTLIHEGQGPGEFSGLLFAIQTDPARDRLYLFGSQIGEYTLAGQFIRQFKHELPVMAEFCIAPNRFAAVAMGFIPFQAGSFGIGVFSEKGEMIWHKNDFYSASFPREISGFTANVANALSNDGQSLLFKTGSNDTVFRMKADSIEIACVLSLNNSDAEVQRALNTKDFSDIQGFNRNDKDIFVQDILETESRYYFRCRYNQGFYILSVDKHTAKAVVERCPQPVPFKELTQMGTYQYGLLGTCSYQQFPVWGRARGKELVQVITPTELEFYKKLKSIAIPASLENKEGNANPFFVFYKLK